MIESIQINAALAAQISPLKLKVGQSDSAVVLNTLGQLKTVIFTRTK